MQNPIIHAMAQTEFLASCFHTPSPQAQALFYTVLRAGHLRASPDYRVERRFCLGQDLLFCLRGAGFIHTQAGESAVCPGDLAWIDGRYPHGHRAQASDPWELLWLRFDSHDLAPLCSFLAVSDTPIFRGLDRAAVQHEFRHIIRLMERRPLAMEALLHAEMANLLAQLIRARLRHPAALARSPDGFSPQLERAFTRMKLYSHRAWRVEELAQIAGLSAPHFFRLFKRATGSSPIAWLRRERINQAKRHLIETCDPVAQIAERVGYSDPFYFSRDFKAMTSHSPSEFRRQEQHHSSTRHRST
jgi:AraC-like DNA-binding protein